MSYSSLPYILGHCQPFDLIPRCFNTRERTESLTCALKLLLKAWTRWDLHKDTRPINESVTPFLYRICYQRTKGTLIESMITDMLTWKTCLAMMKDYQKLK